METEAQYKSGGIIGHYPKTILMILKREIEKFAEAKGVAKTTIDKNWILGYFVDAIFSVQECQDNLISFITDSFDQFAIIKRPLIYHFQAFKRL